jgi:hypothetical protein
MELRFDSVAVGQGRAGRALTDRDMDVAPWHKMASDLVATSGAMTIEACADCDL